MDKNYLSPNFQYISHFISLPTNPNPNPKHPQIPTLSYPIIPHHTQINPKHKSHPPQHIVHRVTIRTLSTLLTNDGFCLGYPVTLGHE
jgi:hypothetical protein